MTSVLDLPQIYANAQAVIAEQQAQMIAAPFVRLWDGNWNLRGVVGGEISGDFKWLLNESGQGVLVLPYDNYLAEWAVTTNGNLGVHGAVQNVHVTVDKNGARWDGRMQKAVPKTDDKGVTTVELTFLHSYEEVKHVYCWSNPFLPAIFQFPKNWLLAGPSAYMLKLTLFCQLLRLEASLWALPDDPLNINEWFNLDQSTWPIVVAPSDLLSDESLWCIINSRWKNFHDLAGPILDYAQLMVTTRRYLIGDPPPWPGANLANGALVVDIVDKSGFYTGTSQGGNVLTGLEYTVEVILNDFLDNQSNVLPDPDNPSAYVNPGWLGTLPNAPWVIYRPELHTGVQTSEFQITPFTDVQILSGGHSNPLINDGITTAIQLAGLLGGAALQAVIGPTSLATVDAEAIASQLADIAVTLLSPLYTDVIGAWVSTKDPFRAYTAGWSHYYEYFQSGGDNAYTLDSLIALTEGMWATRSYFSHKLTVQNGQPFLIGDQGQGHYFLGDRIGSTVIGMPPGEIYVDQVSELGLTWNRTDGVNWAITIGSNKEAEEPLLKGLSMLQSVVGAIQQIVVN